MTELSPRMDQMLSLHLPALMRLWRGGNSSSILTEKEIQRAAAALVTLQRGLTGDRHLAGAGYMDDTPLLGAYLLYYWPVSYMQVSLAAVSACDTFRFQADTAVQERRPFRILDLGSGPGPAATAIQDYIHSMQPEAVFELTLTDSGKEALRLAKQILCAFRADPVKTIKLTATTTNLEKTAQTAAPDTAYRSENRIASADFLQEGPFDIIVMCHALNELWRKDTDRIEKRSSLLESAASHLLPGGFLLIVEPALLETSRDLLSVRDRLCKNGYTVISPCMGNAPCPALSAGTGHTCHAEINWNPPEPVASLAHAAGLDRESVKMSFIIVRPPQKAAAAGSKDNGRRYYPETGLPESDKVIRARVVSDGMLNKAGRIRFLLCDGKNRFPFSAKNDDHEALVQGFFTLRRYDMVEIQNPEIRETAVKTGNTASYGFRQTTKLHILARSET
jgi:SAM-dependent methyltransferase